MICFLWLFWLPPVCFMPRYVPIRPGAARKPPSSFPTARFRSYLLRIGRRFSGRRWFRRPVFWWV